MPYGHKYKVVGCAFSDLTAGWPLQGEFTMGRGVGGGKAQLLVLLARADVGTVRVSKHERTHKKRGLVSASNTARPSFKGLSPCARSKLA